MSERLGEYETLRDQLHTLKNSFQAIVELDEELQGKGAEAIKGFYGAQIDVVDIWIQLTDRNIAFFGGIHGDADGRNLSRETVELPFLEENLNQSERRSDQMIDAQQRELEGILDRIRDIHPLNVFSRERFDTHLEQARKKREDTLDSINRFDEELKREYQHLESSEQMITGLMRQLMESSRQGNHISPLHFNAAAYYSSNAYQITDDITAQTESYLSFKEAQEQAREPKPVPEEDVNENPFMESLNSFKEIGQDFWGGMENRSEKKFDSFYDFGNYITIGALDGGKDMWKGMEDRAGAAVKSPSNFINYLTMGGMDLYNGAVNPDDAFSKEHWLNSFGLAALLAGGAKPGLGVKGRTTVSATARQAVPKVSLNQRWNEIRLGLDDLYNRPMIAAENGMLKGGFGEPGWSRFSIERDVKDKGTRIGDNFGSKNADALSNVHNYSISQVINKHGLSISEFNELRLTDVSDLTSQQKERLKAIRNSVPFPDEKTVLQKVIPSSDIEKYENGTYTKVGGYISRAEDVSHLKTYKDIYNSLRLDYPGTVYDPLSEDVIGIIRYTTKEVSEISIPYGKGMGGIIEDAPPFTGNGFTKAENGSIIPEFKNNKYLEIADGAQLIEVKNGVETIRAIYKEDFGQFMSVD
ncbi:T7SS effector LXG polymorphic toxin [Rossellomorea aquimaris]